MVNISAQAQVYRLAPPLIETDSIVFFKSSDVRLRFDMAGATINYGFGDEAPGQLYQAYKQPLHIFNESVLSVRATHPLYANSEINSIRLFKSVVPSHTVTLSKKNHPHQHLNDNILGNFKLAPLYYPHKEWFVHKHDTLYLEVDLPFAVPIQKVVISVLENPDEHIYPPQEVWAYIDLEQDTLAALESRTLSNIPLSNDLKRRYIDIFIEPVLTRHITLEIIPFKSGASQDSLFFAIDEIIVM